MSGSALIILLLTSLVLPAALPWFIYFYWSVAGFGHLITNLPVAAYRTWSDMRLSDFKTSKVKVEIESVALLAASNVMIAEFLVEFYNNGSRDPQVFYSSSFWGRYFVSLVCGFLAVLVMRLIEHSSMMSISANKKASFVVSGVLSGNYDMLARFMKWNTTEAEFSSWSLDSIRPSIKHGLSEDSFRDLMRVADILGKNENHGA
jgi:hypothetical protein